VHGLDALRQREPRRIPSARPNLSAHGDQLVHKGPTDLATRSGHQDSSGSRHDVPVLVSPSIRHHHRDTLGKPLEEKDVFVRFPGVQS
jgi:hypothetical protein